MRYSRAAARGEPIAPDQTCYDGAPGQAAIQHATRSLTRGRELPIQVQVTIELTADAARHEVGAIICTLERDEAGHFIA